MKYEKPVVLVNEELAEGVYAASGAVSASGSVSVSGVETTSTGNEWYRVNTYSVTIMNSGSEEATDWSASVSVTAGTVDSASTYDTGLANVSLSGSTITITPGDRGAIPAGGSISVTVVASYSSDSITIE